MEKETPKKEFPLLYVIIVIGVLVLLLIFMVPLRDSLVENVICGSSEVGIEPKEGTTVDCEKK